MTTRYERLKMQQRMQRRIRLVVEERRMAAGRPTVLDQQASAHAERSAADPGPGEATIEIPAGMLRRPAPAPPAARAIGRVTVRSA